MNNWSSWLLVLIIVAVIAIGGTLAQRYLDRSTDEMASQLEQVQQAVENQDWKNSQTDLDMLELNWNRTSSNWKLFTDHTELEKVELSLTRLQEFIKARDETNARVEAGAAIDMLENIPESVRLTWQNVF